MKKYIDGTELIDGRLMMGSEPNLLPVLQGFNKVLGLDVMTDYLHECLGYEASFYPNTDKFGIYEISLGNSKGWARLPEQLQLVNYITDKLSVKSGFNYSKDGMEWCGKYNHLIVD